VKGIRVTDLRRTLMRRLLPLLICYAGVVFALLIASGHGHLSQNETFYTLLVVFITTAVLMLLIARKTGKDFRDTLRTAGGLPSNNAWPGEDAKCTVCYAFEPAGALLLLLVHPNKNDRTFRFHSFQSVLFWTVFLGVIFVPAVCHQLRFSLLLHIGQLLKALFLPMTLIWLLLLYKTAKNKRLVLPLIGPLAEKMAGTGEST